MTVPQKIPVFRVKEAYGLNEYEAQELLDELSPDSVFPYELWQKAYSSYWKYPAVECSRLYKVENPPFPELHQLPEKYFPTETYAKYMVDFFFDMARRISVENLENGFNYIVETTYDSRSAVNDSKRAFLFYHLQLVENNIASVTRVEGVKKIDLKLSAPDVLLNMFPDTVAVNNISAIHYWSVIRGYPFIKEGKGITLDLVKYVINAAAQETLPILGVPPIPESPLSKDGTATKSQAHEQRIPIPVPTALWTGKAPEAILAAMRLENYDDAVIAHVLYVKRGFTNKTEIGKLLDPSEREPSTYRKKTDRLLAEASRLNIVDV